MGRVHVDLSGKRFGRLIVKEIAPEIFWKKSGIYWLCFCECGKVCVVKAIYLTNGDTKSCGCLAKEHPPNFTHGWSGTKLYVTWKSMWSRVKNKNTKSYSNYGGRGIEVCSEWADFLVFKQWALSNGYSDDLTIERIDNDGNYCPENCKWIPRVEQSKNRRVVKKVEYNGDVYTLRELSDLTGVSRDLLYSRIFIFGYPVERAITRPKYGNNHTGIHWFPATKKWRANYFYNYKDHHIGYFLSKEDAIKAREDFIKKFHGGI